MSTLRQQSQLLFPQQHPQLWGKKDRLLPIHQVLCTNPDEQTYVSHKNVAGTSDLYPGERYLLQVGGYGHGNQSGPEPNSTLMKVQG